MVEPGRPQFVLFGSSIVQQCFEVGRWGAILADLYDRKADIILRGYSGWNSRRALQVLKQVFPKEAAVQPSLLIVYFGGNDAMYPHPSGLGAHVPLPEYIENIKKIFISSFSRVVPKIEHIVNLWTALQQREDWATTCIRDGIHFLAEGNKIVVKEILRVIKEADWEPNLYLMSMPNEFAEDSPYYMVRPNGKTTINASNGISRWKMKWMVNGINSKL